MISARETLINTIGSMLQDSDRAFLLSFKAKQPDWSLLGLDGVDELPAVKWKQINLNKMAKDKHQIAFDKLKSLLDDK